MKKYLAKIHLDHILLHNCQLADPLNPWKKEMSKISGKRKKTDDDHAAMAEIEFMAGLYLNGRNEPVIPGRMVEAFLLASAKVHKEGKLSAAGIFVDFDSPFTYDGGPMSLEELKMSPEHRLVLPVVVQRSRIMRTRPYFKNVEFESQISVQENICDIDHLVRWLETGLSQVGLGDYRPRYGRGKLLNIAEV